MFSLTQLAPILSLLLILSGAFLYRLALVDHVYTGKISEKTAMVAKILFVLATLFAIVSLWHIPAVVGIFTILFQITLVALERSLYAFSALELFTLLIIVIFGGNFFGLKFEGYPSW